MNALHHLSTLRASLGRIQGMNNKSSISVITQLLALVVGLTLGMVLKAQEPCIEDLPLDPQTAPEVCDGITWCDCVSSGIPNPVGGESAFILQSHIYPVNEPIPGEISIDVDAGTVDRSKIEVGTVIGDFYLKEEIGEVLPFLLGFKITVTEIDEDTEIIHFEIRLVEANPVSEEVLTYDPFDENHSEGLLHVGQLETFGDNGGFIMNIQISPERTGEFLALDDGDINAPNFTTRPFLVIFGEADLSQDEVEYAPNGIYSLPAAGGPMSVETQIRQLTNLEIVKDFEDEIEIDPTLGILSFKRGDVDFNGKLEITDPINNLAYQFLGTFTPPCEDACDFDDNGKVEITDAIANLSHQFLGTAPPAPPGKDSCGEDPTDDTLTCDTSCNA